MKLNLSKHGNLAALLGAAILAVTGAPQDAYAVDTSDPFGMIVIIDAAYGHTVRYGHYDEAIAKLTTGRRKRDGNFAKQTNLCVAYTKTGDLQYAEAACIAAVGDAEERVKLSSSRNLHHLSEYDAAARRDAAIALSNLGVLRAISGDKAGAQSDFESALELKARIPLAQDNLSRLIGRGQVTD